MTPEQAQQRIELALRQEQRNVNDWEDSLDMLLNDFGSNELGEASLAPNVIFGTYRRLLASLSYPRPEFYVRVQDKAGLQHEDAVVATINYYWNTLGIAEQSRMAIADALIYPFGVLQVGMGRAYATERELAEEDDNHEKAADENMGLLVGTEPVISDDDIDEIHLEEHIAFRQSPEILQSPEAELIIEVLDDHIKKHAARYQAQTAIGPRQWGNEDISEPFIRRIRPHDFYWEPGVSHLNEAGYVLVRSWERLADVKDNPRFKNREEVKATTVDPHLSGLYTTEEMQDLPVDADIARVALWNVYDLREMKWSVHVHGQEDPLFEFEDAEDGSGWPYRYVKGYPFSLLTFHTVPDRIAGPGVVEYLKHPQNLTMQLYANIATHSLRSNSRYTAIRDQVDANENNVEAQLTNPEQGAVIWVYDHNAIRKVDSAELDQSVFAAINLVDSTIKQNSGLSGAARADVTGATATETSQAASATNILIADNLGQVVRQDKEVVDILLGMLRQYGPEELTFRDPRVQDQWVAYSRDMLLYEYAINVELPDPGDKMKRQTALINLHHELGASPYTEGEGLREIQKEMVKAYGYQTWERFIREPSAEIEAHIAMENQMMMQGTPVQPVRGEHYSAHLKSHNEVLQQLTQQLQQMGQQLAQGNPQLAQNPQMLQQFVQQQPQAQQMQQIIQVFQQHIQQTQQLAPQAPTGRPRSAVSIPQGNEGRVESITSAQQEAR